MSFHLIAIAVVYLSNLATTAVPGNASYDLLDDFYASKTLNASIWTVVNRNIVIQDEPQYYLPENVYVKSNSSSLYIRCSNTSFGNSSLSVGLVDTRGNFNFTYGEIEWKAKLPYRRWLSPFFWLVEAKCHGSSSSSCDDYPQAPLVEMIAGAYRDIASDSIRSETTVNVYWKAYKAGEIRATGKKIRHDTDMSLDFHMYKIIWEPERLTWIIDGQQVHNVSGRIEIPSVPLQIVMGLAVARKPNVKTKFPVEAVIDYVKVRRDRNAIPPSWNRPDDWTKRVVMPVVVAICGAIIGVLVSVCLMMLVRRHRRKSPKKKMPSVLHTELSNANPFTNPFYRSASLDTNDSQDAYYQHYFSLLEVPFCDVALTEELLGKGEYGLVWKAQARNLPGSTLENIYQVVAVKTTIDFNNAEQQKQFFEEMKLMTKVGRHLNIVNLLGAVTKGKLMLLLEFCPHGSLLKYLKAHRATYDNQVDDEGQMKKQSQNDGVQEPLSNGYVKMMTSVESVESTDDLVLSTHDLISFAYQISRGLEYLASRSIIHRDLAARNVLVGANQIAKIADFGLARQRILADYVLQNDQVALPIKWMAPESLMQRRFSYKTDVWSFGVLMWEIFSLGEAPYTSSSGQPFVGRLTEFAVALSQGMRMQRPPFSPTSMYNLMGQCWTMDPDERPSMADLRKELSGLVSGNMTQYYLKLDEPYQKFNLITQPCTCPVDPTETDTSMLSTSTETSTDSAYKSAEPSPDLKVTSFDTELPPC